jgi:ribosomal protein S18 acetylase RimI-like enzyme
MPAGSSALALVEAGTNCMTGEIRAATPKDLEAAFAILKAALVHMECNGIYQWDDVYPSLSDLSKDIDSGTMYLACKDTVPQGFVSIDRNQPSEYATVSWHYHDDAAVVHRLTVHPDAQGKGVGRHLMDFVESFASKQGCHCVRLDAFIDNPRAWRLYEKRGYRRAGTVTFRKGPFYCYEKGLERGQETTRKRVGGAFVKLPAAGRSGLTVEK